MIYKLYWDNLKILESKVVGDLYYNTIFTENIEVSRDKGLPLMYIKGIRAISDELPTVIQGRIPSTSYIRTIIKNIDNFEDELVEYINKTGCKRVTDYFSLEVEK